MATKAAPLATTSSAGPSPTPGNHATTWVRTGTAGKKRSPSRLQRGVAHPGDRLVVAGVPAEQPLVHAGGHAGGRRVGAVDDEVGQAERPQHHHPGEQVGQHRLPDGLSHLGGGLIGAAGSSGQRAHRGGGLIGAAGSSGSGAYSVRFIGS